MSGRDLHRFLVSHRTQVQDIEQENHLVTRLINGLDSDRYVKVDYQALKSKAASYKNKNLKYGKKVKEIQSTAKLVHDKMLIKHHRMVWKSSMEALGKNVSSIDESCADDISSFIKRTKNYDKEFADEFESCVIGTNEDIDKLDEAVIQPITEFKEDLAYRVRNHGCAEDRDEVLQQLENVKGRSGDVADMLSYQRGALEEDINKTELTKIPGTALPPLSKSIPVDIVFSECPFDDVKNMITRQFVDLHTLYASRLKQEADRQKTLENASDNFERPLSALESWTIERVREIYQLFTPDNLRASCLEGDILCRLLSDRSRLGILRYTANRLKLSYAADRRREFVSMYYRSANDLYHKSMAVFADARAEFIALQNKGIEMDNQRRICDKLHTELNVMRERQAEVLRIKQILADEEEQRRNEELQKQRVLLERKRTQIHQRVSEFQKRKRSQDELKKRENEERLKQLYEDMEKQREYDMTRVAHRSDLYDEKLMKIAENDQKLKEEEYLKLKRLEAIRSTVSVQAECDPARMVQDTQSSRARLGIGVNQEINLQQPLFAVHGFNDYQIGRDKRVRAEEEMRKAGLINTEYAQKMLATLAPPTKPRPDNNSTAFKSTFNDL